MCNAIIQVAGVATEMALRDYFPFRSVKNQLLVKLKIGSELKMKASPKIDRKIESESTIESVTKNRKSKKSELKVISNFENKTTK
jgi:hypothetical protein